MAITQSTVVTYTGEALIELTLPFFAPVQPDSGEVGQPRVRHLSTATASTGGTLTGDRNVYYTIVALDGSSKRSQASAPVEVKIPAGTNTNTVTVSGDDPFDDNATQYEVYRSQDDPWSPLRIIGPSAVPDPFTFTDTGTAGTNNLPPDNSFAFARAYWRKQGDTHWIFGAQTEGRTQTSMKMLLPLNVSGQIVELQLRTVDQQGVETPEPVAPVTTYTVAGVLGTNFSAAVVIDNANFEASSSLPPPGWEAIESQTTLAYETVSQQSGTRSLKVTTTVTNGGARSIRKWKVTPGELYKISGFAKADSTKAAQFGFAFYDASDTFLDQPFFNTTSTAWVSGSDVETAPSGSIYARILLICTTTNGGTVYFDNLFVARQTDAVDEVAGKAVEEIRNPNFESGDRDWVKGTGWTIENDSGNAYDGNFVAKFTTSSANATITNDIFIPIKSGQKRYASCMLKRSAGTDQPRVTLFWYDSSKTFLSSSTGVPVSSSSYAKSEVVATAPASAAFVKIGVNPFWTSGTLTLYADQFNTTPLVAEATHDPGVTFDPSTGSTSFQTIAEMDRTIETRGGKVDIRFHGLLSINGTNNSEVRVLRGSSTVLYTYFVTVGFTGFFSLSWIDESVPVGSNQYRIQFRKTALGGSIQFENDIRSLQLMEVTA